MVNEKKFLRGLIKKIQEKGFKDWTIERICPKSQRTKSKSLDDFSVKNVTLVGTSGTRYKFGQHLEKVGYSEFDVELQYEIISAKQIFNMIKEAYNVRA